MKTNSQSSPREKQDSAEELTNIISTMHGDFSLDTNHKLTSQHTL